VIRTTKHPKSLRIVGLLVAVIGCAANVSAEVDGHPAGQRIYEEHCARCHGAAGEGVAEKKTEPLAGDRALQDLTSVIERVDARVDFGFGDARLVGDLFLDFGQAGGARRGFADRQQVAALGIQQEQQSIEQRERGLVGVVQAIRPRGDCSIASTARFYRTRAKFTVSRPRPFQAASEGWLRDARSDTLGSDHCPSARTLFSPVVRWNRRIIESMSRRPRISNAGGQRSICLSSC
jgi:hypothetical protein